MRLVSATTICRDTEPHNLSEEMFITAKEKVHSSAEDNLSVLGYDIIPRGQ
jgi:hypothetical protein